jgi:hypothetical protein
LSSSVDVASSVVLSLAWCACVRGPLRALFAIALLSSFAPDLVDHTPWILKYGFGLAVPLNPVGPLFPWHWWDGSGSMTPGRPDRFQDLAAGRNWAVSLANHAIVLAFSAGGIALAPWALRFANLPLRQVGPVTSSGRS